jgi:hypothetical protein
MVSLISWCSLAASDATSIVSARVQRADPHEHLKQS